MFFLRQCLKIVLPDLSFCFGHVFQFGLLLSVVLGNNKPFPSIDFGNRFHHSFFHRQKILGDKFLFFILFGADKRFGGGGR